jgi:hypothetical protein
VPPQPVDATFHLERKDGVYANDAKYRRGFTAAEKTELWDHWWLGESLKSIASNKKAENPVDPA